MLLWTATNGTSPEGVNVPSTHEQHLDRTPREEGAAVPSASPAGTQWHPATGSVPTEATSPVEYYHQGGCSRAGSFLLGGGGGGGKKCLSKVEASQEKHRVQCSATFAKTQVASAWVLANPVLVEAWALDRSKITMNSDARRRRRLNT